MELSPHFRLKFTCRPIVLMVCGLVGIWAPLTAELARASCGDYVHLRHAEMLGHGLAATPTHFAGHPFGRSAGSNHHWNLLGARAVLILEAERNAQQARLAGYDWLPDHPVTPCQGPTCGGRSGSSEPPLPPTFDSSSQDRWVVVSSEVVFPDVTRQSGCHDLPGVRLAGDWPEIVRPPNAPAWAPYSPSRSDHAV